MGLVLGSGEEYERIARPEWGHWFGKGHAQEKALGKSSEVKGEQRVAYIKQQGYDEFEQKVYRRLGNDTETTYTYDPVMRRLSSLVAHRDTPVAPSVFQNNRYSYDLVGNILSVENAVSQPPSAISSLGGSSKYTYEYDELNRLIKAKGNFEGTSNKADYELNMQYNRLNGITQKALQYTLNGQDKGYTLDYEYNNPKHPHAPSQIAESGKPKARQYQYDGNGNPTYYDEFKGFRSMVWDEENRLRGINDNGRLHLYTYDHTGERMLKSSAESSMAVINGLASAVITHTEDYTAYVSPYFVVQKGKFTKHFFEGSSRIVSKLGEGTFSQNKPKITAGGIDYFARTQKEQEARDRYIKGLNTPPGPPTQHGIYTTPEWTGQPYPSIDWQSISQNQEPPAGWPRYPKFNEPGDVPGPPVQFGPPVTNANVKAGFNFIPNGVEEKNLYFYHPDHLGSSSYITDKNGEVIQHTEYIAFGEVLVDEHSTMNKMPYLFNGKELDYDTGLYYYGARYYDPKTSLWLNTDPLSGYNPIQETEHYIDGQHNGGIFNPMNMATYSYTYQNPILYVDPNGKQVLWEEYKNKIKQGLNNTGEILRNIVDNIAPIRPLNKQEEIEFQNRYGKSDGNPINDLKKIGNQLVDIPKDIVHSFENFSINNLTENLKQASFQEKVEIVGTLAINLLSLKRGKINTEGIYVLGSSSNKIMYVGGFKVVAETFHREIKGDILKAAGNFSSKVGKNPNINVKDGKIILEGQGSFRGKTFETTLNAKDFLQQ